jgi:hypothetical protein
VLLIISVDLLYEALDHGVRDEHMLCPMIPDYVEPVACIRCIPVCPAFDDVAVVLNVKILG